MNVITTTEASAPNSALAERLLNEAKPLMARRRALLCASTALGTTTTVAAARRALAEWDGPAEVRQDAIAILDAITASTP